MRSYTLSVSWLQALAASADRALSWTVENCWNRSSSRFAITLRIASAALLASAANLAKSPGVASRGHPGMES